MRIAITTLALTVVLAACGSGTLPADELAADDGAHDSGPYKTALDRLAGRCTQTPEQLVSMVEKGRELLRQRGITETDLSIARHAARTIPAGKRMDCVQVIGAYITLREH